MRAALALLVLAGPLRAEPWIDYELLLRQNADKVVVSADASGAVTRILDLGDGVTVSCSDQGCVGMDETGAVGCAWSLYSSLLAVAEVCEIPKERTDRLADMQRRVMAFVAENAVPPRSVGEIEGYHREQVDTYRLGGEGEEPLNCAEVTAPDSDVMMMLEALSADQSATGSAEEDDEPFDLDAFLATPRLPVMNPCL